MAELTLTFTTPPVAELIATDFTHRRLKSAVTARLGAYDRSFKWTAGVQALSVLLLRTAAWGRNSRDSHPEPPCLEGCRPSMAASLNDALTKKPRWIEDVFGVADGRPVLPGLLGRWNADFNTSSKAPVRIWVECEALPAEGIRVRVGDSVVEDPARLSDLADDIVRQRHPGKERQPDQKSGSTPSAPTQPTSLGGVGVNLKLQGRVVVIEIVLDRDFDKFGQDDQDEVMHAIEAMFATGRKIAVLGRQRGSVILTLELSSAQAHEVLRLAGAGSLAHLGVVGARVVQWPEFPAVTGAPAERSDQYLQDCLDRWGRGDREALIELSQIAAAPLERLATAMRGYLPNVRLSAGSGDVIQACWLSLFRALLASRPVTIREFFDLSATALRSALIDIAHEYRRGAIADSATVKRSADEKLGDLELWTLFHESVGNLPPKEREVVGLVFYHGLTTTRVAELCRIDQRTAGNWWRSACKRLRSKVGDISMLSS